MSDAASRPGGGTSVGLPRGWSGVVVVAMSVLAVVVVRNVFVAAQQVLGWAVAASLAAVLLAPVIAFVDRALPHGLAIALTVIGVGAVGVAVVAVYRLGVSEQLDRLVEDVPAIADDIESRSDRIGEVAEDIGLAEQVTEVAERLADRLGSNGALSSVTGSAPAYFISTILMIFLLLFGSRMVEGALGLLPDARRVRIANALTAAVTSTRRTVGAGLVQAAAIGVVFGVLAAAIGVPAAPLLGLIAAVCALVPYLGVLVGSLPIVVLAFGVAPVWQAVGVAGTAVGLQVVESFVVRRRVDRWAMHVGPAIP